SERYQALLGAVEAVLARDHRDASGPTVAAVALQLVKKPFSKLLSLGDTLDSTSSAEQLHALRIRAKRLRYSIEFVGQPFGPPAERLVRRVVELQDLLGKLQDAQVAIDRLRILAAGGSELPPEVVFAMGELAQRYRQEGEGLRTELPKVYHRVTGERW